MYYYFRKDNQLFNYISLILFGHTFTLGLQSTPNGYPIELSELAIRIIRSDIRFRRASPISYLYSIFEKKI
jgi:hypothetical protein